MKSQAFRRALCHKYAEKKLPGLTQFERGHFAIFDWNENFGLNHENWELIGKEVRGLKLAFIMGTWHGFARHKCIRCQKPSDQWDSHRYYSEWFVRNLQIVCLFS